MSFSMQSVLPVLQTFLGWLDGKKTYIVSATILTIQFLVLKNLIDQDTGVYLTSLVTLLGGSAELATVKLGARMGNQQ